MLRSLTYMVVYSVHCTPCVWCNVNKCFFFVRVCHAHILYDLTVTSDEFRAHGQVRRGCMTRIRPWPGATWSIGPCDSYASPCSRNGAAFTRNSLFVECKNICRLRWSRYILRFSERERSTYARKSKATCVSTLVMHAIRSRRCFVHHVSLKPTGTRSLIHVSSANIHM